MIKERAFSTLLLLPQIALANTVDYNEKIEQNACRSGAGGNVCAREDG